MAIVVLYKDVGPFLIFFRVVDVEITQRVTEWAGSCDEWARVAATAQRNFPFFSFSFFLLLCHTRSDTNRKKKKKK
jgi:hypothetical protein